MNYLLIAIGGAAGSVFRYLTVTMVQRMGGAVFPWGTLVVNLIGSLLIGFLWGLSERWVISANLKLFLFVGILGGFTTFSAFSLENFYLFRSGEIKLALLNILVSNVVGILLVLAGAGAGRYLTEVIK